MAYTVFSFNNPADNFPAVAGQIDPTLSFLPDGSYVFSGTYNELLNSLDADFEIGAPLVAVTWEAMILEVAELISDEMVLWHNQNTGLTLTLVQGTSIDPGASVGCSGFGCYAYIPWGTSSPVKFISAANVSFDGVPGGLIDVTVSILAGYEGPNGNAFINTAQYTTSTQTLVIDLPTDLGFPWPGGPGQTVFAVSVDPARFGSYYATFNTEAIVGAPLFDPISLECTLPGYAAVTGDADFSVTINHPTSALDATEDNPTNPVDTVDPVGLPPDGYTRLNEVQLIGLNRWPALDPAYALLNRRSITRVLNGFFESMEDFLTEFPDREDFTEMQVEVDMDTNRITDMSSGTAPNDLVTKAQVEGMA